MIEMRAATLIYPEVRGGERTVHLREGVVSELWYAHRPGHGTLTLATPPALDLPAVMEKVWQRWPDCSIELVNA